MIKNFKYDKKHKNFTSEIEDFSLDEFITIFVMRNYNNKINYIGADKLKAHCIFNNIPYEESFLKIDLIKSILQHQTLEEKLSFCDTYGIGVTKYNYLASGMSEEEYSKAYKDFKVIGVEMIKRNAYKNLYSIKGYIDYINNKEECAGNNIPDGFLERSNSNV